MGVSVVLYVQSLDALDVKQSLGQCHLWGRDQLIVHSGAPISEFAPYAGGRVSTSAAAPWGRRRFCRLRAPTNVRRNSADSRLE